MRNQLLVALVILLGAAMAWDAQPALRAAPPNPPSTTPAPPPALTDLQKEAARLSEVTGFAWRASSRELASGVGPELSAGTSAWHGTAVPYIVLPFGLDDEGKAKLALYRQNNNNALDMVAANAQRIFLAGPSREPDVTAKILAALNMQESRESAQLRLSHARADWLDFRLAVAKASDKDAKLPTPLENGPTPAQIDDYARLLADKGPNGGRNRGDPFLWYHPLALCDLPASLVTTADRQKVPYVLLSNLPEQVMLNASARPRPWHLKRVYAATDAQNQPAVAMEFDDAAAKLLGTLTEANIGRPLAVLFHNQLLAVVKIDAKITNKLLITGGKLDKTLADRIVRSLSECMLAENETSRP